MSNFIEVHALITLVKEDYPDEEIEVIVSIDLNLIEFYYEYDEYTNVVMRSGSEFLVLMTYKSFKRLVDGRYTNRVN